MIKNKILFAMGQISLAIGIILNRFINDQNSIIDFTEGLLLGLSLILNLFSIIQFRKISND